MGHGTGEGETRWKSKSKEDFKKSCWVRSSDEVVEEDVDEGEYCEEESQIKKSGRSTIRFHHVKIVEKDLCPCGSHTHAKTSCVSTRLISHYHLVLSSRPARAASANSEELRSSVLVDFDHPVHQSFECHTVSSRNADCCSVPHLL